MAISMIFFITGTDTDCGKTTVATGLLALAKQKGYSTLGIKPIASGSRRVNGELRNQDALKHMKYSSIKTDYPVINPFCFEPAIAPHIAAKKDNQAITSANLTRALHPAFNVKADFKVIEGAGGWHVPINDVERYSDWVIEQKFEVIVVVGIKLGAINHALLTMESIARADLIIAGWIGNCIDPNMQNLIENIEFLKSNITSPCLGIVPYIEGCSAEELSKYLSLPQL